MTAPQIVIPPDTQAAAKAWLIDLLGDTAHVCYRLPDGWDLEARPAVTVQLIDEMIGEYVPMANVQFQFRVWGTVMAAIVPIKSTILNGLFGLTYEHWMHTPTGQELAGAGNTSATYQPDTSETVRGHTARHTPSFLVTTEIAIGQGA